MEKVGGRKYVYVLTVIILSSMMVFMGMLDPVQWLTFAEVMGGIYVVGNVTTKAIVKPENKAPDALQ